MRARRLLRVANLIPALAVVLIVCAATMQEPTGARPTQGLDPPIPDPAPTSPASVGRCPGTRTGLAFYRESWARWHRQTGAPVFAPHSRPRWCSHARRLAKHWRHRSRDARARFERWYDRTYAKWECVHVREARWHSNTGNGYYGGLQFDATFERAYGRRFVVRWGHAHLWPVWAQLVTAERGWRHRGWWPWPNTARACGLL